MANNRILLIVFRFLIFSLLLTCIVFPHNQVIAQSATPFLATKIISGPNSLWISKPGKPVLIAPADKSKLSDGSITFRWQPVEQATTYRMQIVRWMDKKVVFERNIGSETSYQFDNFPADGFIYLWRVMAGNSAGWGPPSKPYSFAYDLLSQRSSELKLLSPANNSIIPGKEVTFEWSRTRGATSYYLHLLKEGEPYALRKQIRNSTRYYHDQLDADGSTYKWKVEARIWWLWSRTSTTWEFVNIDDDTERRDKELNVCEEWTAATSGGFGTTVDRWDISEVPAGASFDIKFETYQVPDKIEIQYQGVTVYDSGWRGQQSYVDNNPQFYPGGLAGPGRDKLEGIFRKGSEDHFILTVYGPESRTKWQYNMKARCQGIAILPEPEEKQADLFERINRNLRFSDNHDILASLDEANRIQQTVIRSVVRGFFLTLDPFGKYSSIAEQLIRNSYYEAVYMANNLHVLSMLALKAAEAALIAGDIDAAETYYSLILLTTKLFATLLMKH